MENNNQTELVISSVDDLKVILATNYQKQIENFLGDKKKSLRFLSGVVAACQRNPKLLKCTPISLVNSFMVMAQLDLMPSDVSGEAYVIPYENSKKLPNGQWDKVLEAQFQMGYQGWVTLFYRAGIKEIIAEIVRKNDKFEYVNGKVHHAPDMFSDDRGIAIGAYAILRLPNGGELTKVMSEKEILEIARRFSKSYKSDKSPWMAANDPMLWMWKKTVLMQLKKLAPKSEALIMASEADLVNYNGVDRANTISASDIKKLTMGSVVKPTEEPADEKTDDEISMEAIYEAVQ